VRNWQQKKSIQLKKVLNNINRIKKRKRELMKEKIMEIENKTTEAEVDIVVVKAAVDIVEVKVAVVIEADIEVAKEENTKEVKEEPMKVEIIRNQLKEAKSKDNQNNMKVVMVVKREITKEETMAEKREMIIKIKIITRKEETSSQEEKEKKVVASIESLTENPVMVLLKKKRLLE
jgi:hypothetical protein